MFSGGYTKIKCKDWAFIHLNSILRRVFTPSHRTKASSSITVSKSPALVWKIKLIPIMCLRWLYLCLLFKYCLLNLKGKRASRAPWHSRRLLRRRFLLFTKGFSLRTVGILVLAHPTQNLFAQIFPIILQTTVWQKHLSKMRFCLVTLSYTVTSKVSPAHSMNNKSNKPKKPYDIRFP